MQGVDLGVVERAPPVEGDGHGPHVIEAVREAIWARPPVPSRPPAGPAPLPASHRRGPSRSLCHRRLPAITLWAWEPWRSAFWADSSCGATACSLEPIALARRPLTARLSGDEPRTPPHPRPARRHLLARPSRRPCPPPPEPGPLAGAGPHHPPARIPSAACWPPPGTRWGSTRAPTSGSTSTSSSGPWNRPPRRRSPAAPRRPTCSPPPCASTGATCSRACTTTGPCPIGSGCRSASWGPWSASPT